MRFDVLARHLCDGHRWTTYGTDPDTGETGVTCLRCGFTVKFTMPSPADLRAAELAWIATIPAGDLA